MSKPAAEKVDHFRAMLPGAMRKKSRPRGARVNAMFEPVECGQQVLSRTLSFRSLPRHCPILARWLVDQCERGDGQ
jgi:hypothetical protein